MKTLATQFDDRRLSNAVATPTCSSCCCCCCCLATSIASSSLLAQRIGKEGEKQQIPNRHLLTVLAALFVPIVGGLIYLGYWTINSFVEKCTEHVVGTFPGETYRVCTATGSSLIYPLLFIAPFLVLWYLYSQVRIPNPAKRASLVTILIAIAFTIELFAGAFLILTGVGGIGYLILIPIIVGWITVWYHRHLGKDANNKPSTQQTEALTEQHEENSNTTSQSGPGSTL